MGQAEDPPLQSGDKILAGTSAIKPVFNTLLKGLPLAGTAKDTCSSDSAAAYSLKSMVRTAKTNSWLPAWS